VCENGNNAEPISISECAQESVTAAVLVGEVLVRAVVIKVAVETATVVWVLMVADEVVVGVVDVTNILVVVWVSV
jgi:hypothetical protein